MSFCKYLNRAAGLNERERVLLDILVLAEAKGIRFATPPETLHIESLPVEKSTIPAPTAIFQ